MQRLLTKGIGHNKFIKTSIGRIPETWRVVKLGESLDLCEYGISVWSGLMIYFTFLISESKS
jgi:type I restriction enzyme S subunit